MHDLAISLARLYGWDYHQVMALPPDYVDELVITLKVERAIADEAGQAAAEKKQREAKVAQWRATNRRTLAKQGLSPVH